MKTTLQIILKNFIIYAIELIQKGKAFVCDLSVEKIKQYRGTLSEPGKK